MNPIPNPGFEEGYADVVWTGLARVSAIFEHHSGSFACQLRVRRIETGGIWGTTLSSIEWPVIPLTVGVEYPVSLWALAGGDVPGMRIRAQVDPGSGVLDPGWLLETTAGWQLWEPGSFTAVGPVGRLKVSVEFDLEDEVPFFGYWVIDDASMEAPVVEARNDMAVMLSERARKALLGTLQDHLNDMLTYIDLERADGLQMFPIQSWFGFRRPDDAGPENAEVQVYRRGSVSFPGWARNMNTQLGGGSPCVLHSLLEFEIRVQWANRAGLSTSVLRDAGDRYEAALVRVFRDDPHIGQGQVAFINELTLNTDFVQGDAEGRSWGRTTASVTVDLDEDAVGEGIAAGGIPPAAVAEIIR